MNQYEYCLRKFDGKGLLGGTFDLSQVENEFNRMGKDGWELISIVDTSQELGSTRWIVATFKRSSKEDQN